MEVPEVPPEALQGVFRSPQTSDLHVYRDLGDLKTPWSSRRNFWKTIWKACNVVELPLYDIDQKTFLHRFRYAYISTYIT